VKIESRENRRATRAIIHLDHLVHNLECIQRLTGGSRKICIAVKADAYGHGAVEVSRRALEWGVDCLAVATVAEALVLREARIHAPVILFSFPSYEEIRQLVSLDITPFIGDLPYARELEKEAARQGKILKVHMKVDTGMGRIGVTPADAPALAAWVSGAEHLTLEGVCTHFPVSDSPDREDIEFTENQIRIFLETVEALRARGIDPGLLHAANSGAIIAHKSAHFDMVRPGICLYGYYPDPRMERTADFRPVMELVSKIVFVKKVEKGASVSYGRTWRAEGDTWIGTIPAGYADGYNRLLSSKGKVLIRGKLYPVAGRVCMDQFMIDLGTEPAAGLFDRAVLFGPDPRGLSARDIAELTGTIPYEVTCNINKRVPRDYTG